MKDTVSFGIIMVKPLLYPLLLHIQGLFTMLCVPRIIIQSLLFGILYPLLVVRTLPTRVCVINELCC